MTVHATSSKRASWGPPIHREPSRRGMLLLLVVLMLALFMAIGSWLITVAMRSRASSRAFASASSGASLNDILYRQTLDEALMDLLRGDTNGCVATGETVECLLADKYGPPISFSGATLLTGTLAPSATGPTRPLLAVRLSGTARTLRSLNGRILTVVPQANDGDLGSFRILGVDVPAVSGTTLTSGTCYLDNRQPKSYRRFPLNTVEAIVNGREFPTLGIQATGTATVNSSGAIASITVTGTGRGYSPNYPAAVFIDPPPSGINATAVYVTGSNGSATIQITNAGSGYPPPPYTPPNGPPKVSIAMPQAEQYDAFDSSNPLLAKPVITGGSLSFDRISFFGSLSGTLPTNFDGPYDRPIVGTLLSGTTVGYPVGVGSASLYADSNRLPDGAVDNDNDGVPDGIWLPSDQIIANAIAAGAATPPPFVIADRPSPLGGRLRFQVSYLVLDLDGRINVNAAGMAFPAGMSFPSDPGVTDVPTGMGYGPAELDASALFSATTPVLPTGTGTTGFVVTGTGPWRPFLYGGTQSSGTIASVQQRRVPPAIGGLTGRYGPDGAPGITGDDSDGNRLATNSTTGASPANYLSTVSGTSAIADLKGAKKFYLSGTTANEFTPTLIFATGNIPVPNPLTSADFDAADDPYELRLDTDAPRPTDKQRNPLAINSGTTNDLTVDNPFALSELETILRATDPDATQLPQRLAATAGDQAQTNRFNITTDSWDTPALAGPAARIIEDTITSGSLATTGTIPFLSYSGSSAWRSLPSSTCNPITPEIAAGLRFNINRPILTPSDRHEYCKGLYTLSLLLGETNTTRAAQWAVNVLDFRDSDDVISAFEYDTNISNGWNVDGDIATTTEPDRAVVWGAEKPDVVITETAATAGGDDISDPNNTKPQLFVTLRRMPHAAVTVSTTGTTPVTSQSRRLASPEWQLRCPDNQIVRFPPVISGSTYFLAASGSVTTITPTVIFSGTSPSQLAVSGTITLSSTNAHVCVCPPAPNDPFSVTIPPYTITTGGSFSLPSAYKPGDTATIYLERLADPSLGHSITNPYIVVDEALVKIPPKSASTAQTSKRPSTAANPFAAFWAAPASSTVWQTGSANSLGGFSSGTTVRCFHWPNRPFVSVAELAMVPTGTGSPYGYRISTDVNFPTTSLVSSTTRVGYGTGGGINPSGTSTLGRLLLESLYVPSRFAGNTLTVSGSSVDRLGLDIANSGSGQLSNWREPGKINVNTMPLGTSLTDNMVWYLLLNGTSVPFTNGTVISGSPWANSPASDAGHLLSFGTSASGSSAVDPIAMEDFTSGTSDPTKLRQFSPFHAYIRAHRMVNMATVRSQVYAVWISIKITDDSPNAPPPVVKRMFAFVDRSIPVGYAPGRDLNVRDTIRLKRYLD